MAENKRIPAIRFAGFTEAWEQRKLSEIADIVGGGTPSTQIEEYWDGDIDWYAPAEMLGQNYVNGSVRKITQLGLQKSSAKILPAHKTILFTSRAGIGKMAILQRNGATNQGFQSLVLKDNYHPYFIYSMGSKIKDKAESIASGSTFLEISGKMLGNVDIFCPLDKEQKSIGILFENFDNLITLHQRKYDKLVNIKKSLLEKMFPQKGSNVPEIRFKGFTEAWEQRKFKELVEIERGGSPRPIEEFITNDKSGLNWVKIGDAPEQGNYITKTAEKIKPSGLSKTREVHPGDLILSNSMSFGKPYIMAINGCIHDGWLLIRNDKNNFDLRYLCVLLGTEQMLDQYKSFAAGSTVNNLNKELVGNTVVSFPKITEQQIIGKYFSQIENLITLHQRKCEKLKNIKKSLLEKMFV